MCPKNRVDNKDIRRQNHMMSFDSHHKTNFDVTLYIFYIVWCEIQIHTSIISK